MLKQRLIILMLILLLCNLSSIFTFLAVSDIDNIDVGKNINAEERQTLIRELKNLLNSINASAVCAFGLFLMFELDVIPFKYVIMYVVSFFYDDVLEDLNNYIREITREPTKEELLEMERLIKEAAEQKRLEVEKEENDKASDLDTVLDNMKKVLKNKNKANKSFLPFAPKINITYVKHKRPRKHKHKKRRK